MKITGLRSTIGVDSIDAQPREVNNPLTAIGRTNSNWLCDATDPHAQYERGCRIRVDGATSWNAVGQATNVRRHYYPGGDGTNGSGGQTSINFRAKDADGNFVEDAGRPRDGFPDPDAAIARAQADTSLSTTRRSEVIRTPRLPHFRTLWWMRKKTSSDWAHLWGQGGLALGGTGWASRGPQPACTGLGGEAPAASGASGAQVACDPDGDLDVNMVQLLTDPAIADRFISEMNERGAGLKRWWDADDAIPDEPWLLGMSDDTFGFVCDGRAQRASEWNASGCYDARYTLNRDGDGLHDAGLTAAQGEFFSGERRGDGDLALNYDIELDLEDADEQPYAYYQQPFDLKSVSGRTAPPFSIDNRRLRRGNSYDFDQPRAMSCPWTTDDRYWGSHSHAHDGEHHELTTANAYVGHGSTPDTQHGNTAERTHRAFRPLPYPGSTGNIHPWQQIFRELNPRHDVGSSHHDHDATHPTTDDGVAWVGERLFGHDTKTSREAWKCEFDDELVGNVTAATAPKGEQHRDADWHDARRAARPAAGSSPNPATAAASSSVPEDDAVLGEWVDGWRWDQGEPGDRDDFSWFTGEQVALAAGRVGGQLVGVPPVPCAAVSSQFLQP